MLTKLVIIIIFMLDLLLADPSFSYIPKIDIDNQKKYNLGKLLFFDKNLSSNKKISCSTCHNLNKGGSDQKKLSYGVDNQKSDVNSPTIFNTRFNISQDWIGYSLTIKDRTNIAFLNPKEMDGDEIKVLKYIKSNKELKDLYITVYKNFKYGDISDAIAYYVKNLNTPNSKFDKFLKGDKDILTKQEYEGYKLFKDYGCVSCHNGINIGGNMYQKFGIFNEKDIIRDKNLGRYIVTKKEYDKYVFKVPTLRNISKTYPYMHNGEIDNLETAIKEMGKYQLGIIIQNKDIERIEIFLKTLEGDIVN
ncbi:MAG: cytochrome c peroxidase [Campylobacterota bacterium]|nr:cytochrome c peroxidase [Campylobacterota bacterium]